MTAGATVLPPVRKARKRRDRDHSGTSNRLPGDPGDPGGFGGGGGGGGWDGGWEDQTPEPAGTPRGSAELGFALFMFGIGTLFLVFLLACLVLHRNSPELPLGFDGPPDGLWASTGVLIFSSLAMVKVVRARRGERRLLLQRWLRLATVLGVAFLLIQAFLWRGLLETGLFASSHAYGAMFYSLTGLHALHVIGGIGFLVKVSATTAALPSLTSVELCAMYWHFMGVIWLALFGVLYFLS